MRNWRQEMIVCDIMLLRHQGPFLAIKHVTFAVGTTLDALQKGAYVQRGWRWCFLIIPVCVLLSVTIRLCLNTSSGAKASDLRLVDELKKMDYIGSSMLTASVVMILVALSTEGAPKSPAWSDPEIMVPIVLGVLGVAVFASWKCSKYCAYPIMPHSVFSNRTTSLAFDLTTIHL
jgi:hypothetical protein